MSDRAKVELPPLYDAWMNAVIRKDRRTLESLAADEFSYTASSQGRLDRTAFLDMLAGYDMVWVEFLSLDVRQYGETAVVLVRQRQEATVDGAPRSGELLVTDTWVHRDGRWQVVARSSIMLAPRA